MNTQSTISRSDRDALLKYDRGRVKARKEDAEAYGAHLIAQFEEQLAREYSFDEDATWKAATESADEAVKAAQRKIAERCAELGIPKWAWSALSGVGWYRRGESAVKERRAELRKVAQSRAAALVKATKARIERDSIEFQGKLRISGEPIELRQFRTVDYWFYYLRLKDEFLKLMADFRPDMALRPIPDARSVHGRWQSYADRWFEETDHLSRIARITTGQIKKLELAGIHTLAALANWGDRAVPRMSDETRMKLVQQARIQIATRALRFDHPDAPPAFKMLPHRTEKRGA